MKSYIYKPIFVFLVGIIFFADIYSVSVINATQFVLYLNYRSDVEIIGPGDRLDIQGGLEIDAKIISKKDPATKEYTEIVVPFKFKTATHDNTFIMAPPGSTNLVIGRFIQ